MRKRITLIGITGIRSGLLKRRSTSNESLSLQACTGRYHRLRIQHHLSLQYRQYLFGGDE